MNEPRRILVMCTYVIPVEFPGDWTDEMIRREIESKCQGTGFVGDHYQKQKKESMCWAFTLDGEAIAAGLQPAEMKIAHRLERSTQN